MSSYRRYATHKDAVARATLQLLRHRTETGPFEWIVKTPAAVENMLRGMESLRASLENWPVPDLSPLFQSQTPPPDHDVAGCTGAWNQYRSGRRKCCDCGEEMSTVPKPEPRVVGYRGTGDSSILRCLDHPPYEKNYIPVTSEDLENGGICTWCGNDLLAHPGVNQ